MSPARLRATLLALGLLFATAASANRAGITGRAQQGCGGSGCHTGGEVPQLRLEGPTQVEPGGTASFVLTVSGGQTQAGANIATNGGVLIPRDANLQARLGQLTHDGGATAYADGEARFEFDLRAPDVSSTVTLFVAANSVNGNFLPEGDRWALATATLVVGEGGAPIDGGVIGADAAVEDDDDEDDGSCRAVGGGASPGLLLLVGLGLVRRRAR